MSHQCLKTEFSFHFHNSKCPWRSFFLLIWTSHVIAFWTGGKLTSVDKNNQKLNIIMAILWWISHLLWYYTMKSAPNWQNNYIIGFLIIKNIRFDTNIVILLCLEHMIRSYTECCRYAAILDSEKAKPMASSHPGQISSTYQELMKNAKKWLLPEIAHFTPNMGFCHRTTTSGPHQPSHKPSPTGFTAHTYHWTSIHVL